MSSMTLWDRLCIHACYHWWNPILWILDDEWVLEVYRHNGPDYPGWQ